ncbi:FTR1 family protein [Fictibacillus sp. Mic-4]|uniref:FTR1 family iron permease n=1 Tax=Fictibacillus sp. Mic-4 TaxID=3132826 RepID=UPI003CEAD605
MKQRGFLSIVTAFLFVYIILGLSNYAQAAVKPEDDVKKAEELVDQAIKLAKQNKLNEAKKTYEDFNNRWLEIEDGVRKTSSEAYADIEDKMGQVSFAVMQNKKETLISTLESLKKANEKFINGNYKAGSHIKKNVSLKDYISLLKETKSLIKDNQYNEAKERMNEVKSTWLSVEGNVVSQSKAVYDSTERDMGTVSALLHAQKPNTEHAVKIIDHMIDDLEPLANQNGYGIIDAALIPIREGLEALLVVGALLSFTKKAKAPKANKWIIGGVGAGILSSIALALLVSFIFTSVSFGDNNFLIVGWTGIIAALMLLYVSYWLHRQSHISNWTSYIREKSEAALGTGKMFSFALLSFLAVFREGTETVLFLIGLIQHMTPLRLLSGIALGLGTLAVIAFIFIKVGLKIPLKPFFIVSSVIVFYLCLKFTGTGIHSLQLAGVIPANVNLHLPSINFIGFYPSWYSAIPQIILVVAAIAVLLITTISKKQKAALKG